MNSLILFLLILGFSSCGHTQEKLLLGGTKWNYYTTKNALDYIIFNMDSSYISYVDAVDEKYFGNYKVEGDTIYIFQEKGEYDKEFPEGSIHRAGKEKGKLLYKDGRLIPIISKEAKLNMKKHGFNWEEIFYMKDKEYLAPENIHEFP